MKGEQQKKEATQSSRTIQPSRTMQPSRTIQPSRVAILDELSDYLLDCGHEITEEDRDWNDRLRVQCKVDKKVQRHIAKYRPSVADGLAVMDNQVTPGCAKTTLLTALRDAKKAGTPTLDNVSDPPPLHLRVEIGSAVDLEIIRVWRANLKRMRKRVGELRAIDKAAGKSKLTGVTKGKKTKKSEK